MQTILTQISGSFGHEVGGRGAVEGKRQVFAKIAIKFDLVERSMFIRRHFSIKSDIRVEKNIDPVSIDLPKFCWRSSSRIRNIA